MLDIAQLLDELLRIIEPLRMQVVLCLGLRNQFAIDGQALVLIGHLVAWKANHAFDVVQRRIVRVAKNHYIAALRLTVGELIIVEWIFSWPGLGRTLALILIAPMGAAFDSPLFLHPPTLGAVLAVFAALFLVGDLASGLIARLADPALRAESHAAEGVASEA